MLSREDEGFLAALPSASSALSVSETVLFALRFLARNWLRLLLVACIPLLVSAVILYVALGGYLSELERFQGAPDPRVAGIALAELAAGIFAALFSFSLLIVAITAMLAGEDRPFWRGLFFRQQEWRLYAAYLKYLVAVFALFAIVGGLGTIARAYVPLWFFFLCAVIGAIAIYVRTAFLFPPLIMSERGPIVRRAWHMSGRDAWRIAFIVLLLSLPGVIAEMVSEYGLRLTGMFANFSPNVSFMDYAPGVRRVLPGALLALTVWLFFSATLLTAGATSVYRALAPGRERPR